MASSMFGTLRTIIVKLHSAQTVSRGHQRVWLVIAYAFALLLALIPILQILIPSFGVFIASRYASVEHNTLSRVTLLFVIFVLARSFYYLRSCHRFQYGVLELLFAFFLGYKSLGEFGKSGFVAWGGCLSAAYIIVRGFDNIDQAIKSEK